MSQIHGLMHYFAYHSMIASVYWYILAKKMLTCYHGDMSSLIMTYIHVQAHTYTYNYRLQNKIIVTH